MQSDSKAHTEHHKYLPVHIFSSKSEEQSPVSRLLKGGSKCGAVIGTITISSWPGRDGWDQHRRLLAEATGNGEQVEVWPVRSPAGQISRLKTSDLVYVH